MSSRKTVSLFVTFIALLIVACGPTQEPSNTVVLPALQTPTSGSSTTSVESGSCENKLLPVVQGATWVYYSSGGPNGDFSYSDTISETHDGGFTLTSQFPALVLNQQWQCTNEGLVARQLGGGTTASVSMQNMISNFKTISIEGLSLPTVILPGQNWNYHLSMEGSVATPGGTAQSPGLFNLSMQETGTETVTTPAGMFEATRIQATFDAQISIDFQGSAVPYMVNGSSIVWYAPGIGFIKSIENIDFSGSTFTSTTELQTYSIP